VEDEDQSLTASERTERQELIDEALEQINQVATSEIAGRRRLDGGADHTYQGGRTDKIEDLRVYTARDTTIRINVSTKATQGDVTYTGVSGQFSADATFTVEGKDGSVEFTVAQNDLLSDVADNINQESHKTGIVAEVSGDALKLKTVDYGSRASLDVSVSSGAFVVTGGNGNGSTASTDAVAKINDRTITGDGNRFNYNANGTRFAVEVAANFSGAIGTVEVSASRVAQFTISTDPSRAASFALPGVQTAHFRGLSGSLDELGSGRSLSGLGSNTSQAIRVVDDALSRLTEIEGRIDGFADSTIQSSAALLAGFADVVDATITSLNEANPNEESLLLSKNQDLAENALASLSVLDQQRSLIVSLLSRIAGI
jgi:hypothetical protein